MNIIQVLQSRSKIFYASLIVLGLLNSVFSVGMLILINSIISGNPLPIFPEYDWLIFITLIIVTFVVSRIFQMYMVHLTNGLVFDFEVSVLQKIRLATYQAFERLGVQRVHTALGDVRALGTVPQTFVSALTSSVTVVCALAYLFWTSPWGAATILVLMVALFIFYTIQNKSIEKLLNKLRDLQNYYYKYLQDLLLGFKEIRMSKKKTETIYDNYLKENRSVGKQLINTVSIRYLDNGLIAGYSWYLVIGAVIFVLPKFFDLDVAQTTIFLIAILYLMGPIAILTSLVPAYTNVKIALERLTQFDYELGVTISETTVSSEELTDHKDFESIRFEDVTFEYLDKDNQRTFTLSPLNLTIEKGQIIFITGGNGGGKSTFANLLTGLYRPAKGNIYLNGEMIVKENYFSYSDKISAVFCNNYLFTENYDEFDLSKNNQVLNEYLKVMKLDQVVIRNENNTISHDLSKGQHKRLALIYALMEEKQILVLDEWAAEQDPRFRSFFYKNLLPELKQRGKTIIAITHDDDFYHLADRTIKFDFGKIVSDEKIEHVLEPATVSA